jgi:hypothetical protein
MMTDAEVLANVDILAAFLRSIGAFQTAHSGRTLGHHLLGTYGLLADAGCDRATCLAGGLHSVYGTQRFKTKLLSPTFGPGVDRIQTLFGHRVEELVFWFSEYATADIEDITATDPLDGDVSCLCLITAANILEQGGDLDRWPRISEAWERQIAAQQESGRS